MQTSIRLVGETEAGLLIVKRLVHENANAVCQAALRPFIMVTSLIIFEFAQLLAPHIFRG